MRRPSVTFSNVRKMPDMWTSGDATMATPVRRRGVSSRVPSLL